MSLLVGLLCLVLVKAAVTVLLERALRKRAEVLVRAAIEGLGAARASRSRRPGREDLP